MIENKRIDTGDPMRLVYKPLTSVEIIEMLQQWPSDTRVYVDFDREGGNENQVRHVRPFNEWGMKGIKLL